MLLVVVEDGFDAGSHGASLDVLIPDWSEWGTVLDPPLDCGRNSHDNIVALK